MATSFSTGESTGSSTGQSTSQSSSFIPNYPQSPFLLALAGHIAAYADKSYADYDKTFKPLEQSLITRSNQELSPTYQAAFGARAAAGAEQNFEQQRLNALRELGGYGVGDPSNIGRTYSINAQVRGQGAAAAAGASNEAMDLAQRRGVADQAAALQLGQNSLNRAAALQNTAMGLKYPPLGQQSSSQSTQESHNQSTHQTDSNSPDRQPQQPRSGGGDRGGGGGGGNGGGGNGGGGLYTGLGKAYPEDYGLATGRGGGSSVTSDIDKSIFATGPEDDFTERTEWPDYPPQGTGETPGGEGPFGGTEDQINQIWGTSDPYGNQGDYTFDPSNDFNQGNYSYDNSYDPTAGQENYNYDNSYDPTAGSDYSGDSGGGDYYARGGTIHGRRFVGGGALPLQDGGEAPASASPSGGAETDDITAKVNADEFVIPKDVALWKGQEYFYKLMDSARKLRLEYQSGTKQDQQSAPQGMAEGGPVKAIRAWR